MCVCINVLTYTPVSVITAILRRRANRRRIILYIFTVFPGNRDRFFDEPGRITHYHSARVILCVSLPSPRIAHVYYCDCYCRRRRRRTDSVPDVVTSVGPDGSGRVCFFLFRLPVLFAGRSVGEKHHGTRLPS